MPKTRRYRVILQTGFVYKRLTEHNREAGLNSDLALAELGAGGRLEDRFDSLYQRVHGQDLNGPYQFH